VGRRSNARRRSPDGELGGPSLRRRASPPSRAGRSVSAGRSVRRAVGGTQVACSSAQAAEGPATTSPVVRRSARGVASRHREPTTGGQVRCLPHWAFFSSHRAFGLHEDGKASSHVTGTDRHGGCTTNPGVSMSRISRPFTTRRTVLGVPVGRRHTDWAGVRKAAIVGAGALSTAAGGARVLRGGVPTVIRNLPGQVAGTATEATGQLRKATGQLAGTAAGRLGQLAPEAPSKDRVDSEPTGRSRSGRAGAQAGRSGSGPRTAARSGSGRTRQSTSGRPSGSSGRTGRAGTGSGGRTQRSTSGSRRGPQHS
jgi:hypothetical protein